MIEATLRNHKTTCSVLKNKGKTIYCDKIQFSLEKVQHITSQDSFEVTFYAMFGIFSGKTFESVEEIERLNRNHFNVYRLHMTNGETERVEGTIKEISD